MHTKQKAADEHSEPTSPRLKVDASDDVAELEADAIADRVVAHLHDGQRADRSAHGYVRRAADDVAAAEIGLAGGPVSPDSERRIAAARTGGRSLPAVVRRDMETAFGTDFADVRVHTGNEARDLNQGMSARAFTVGNDIFFRDGLPDASHPSGAHLLAHELSHVVQQGSGRAARAVVRRDVLSHAPKDVRIRSGESDTAVAVATPEEAVAAHGATLGSKSAGLKGADSQGAPVDSPGFTPSTPEEAQAKAAMPSLSSIVIPGVTAERERSDPFKAATAYESYAGNLLKNTQRSEVKIEAAGRFVEGEHAKVIEKHEKYKALTGTDKDTVKKRKQMELDMGGAGLPDDKRANIWSAVLDIAEERTRLAGLARQNADEDVPLVDSVYEQTREVKKQALADTKKRSLEYTQNRAWDKAKAGDFAGRAKHRERENKMGALSAQLGSLGTSVRNAHLSDSRLTLKATELESHKKSINDAKTLSEYWAGKGKWVGKKAIGAVVSTVTAGYLQTEESEEHAGKDRTDQVLDKVGLQSTNVKQRLARSLKAIEEVREKKAYGKGTRFHLALQRLSDIVKELRGIVGGVATLVGLLGTAVTVVAPPVGAVISGIAIVLGLLALALTMFKTLIDGILAGWSTLQRGFSANKRNHNLVSDRRDAQGAEAVKGMVNTGAAFAMPMLMNAEFHGHGLLDVTRPDQQLSDMRSQFEYQAQTGAANYAYGQTAASVAEGMATDIGTEAAGGKISGDNLETATKHKRVAAKTPASRPKAAHDPADKHATAAHQAKTMPHKEPTWIKDARKSEAQTRDTGMDTLVTRHMGKLKEFSTRTQSIMELRAKAKAQTDAATAKLATTKKKDEDGALDSITAVVAATEDAVSGVGADSKQLDAQDLKTDAATSAPAASLAPAS